MYSIVYSDLLFFAMNKMDDDHAVHGLNPNSMGRYIVTNPY